MQNLIPVFRSYGTNNFLFRICLRLRNVGQTLISNVFVMNLTEMCLTTFR